jgi:hypothetical protein
MQGNSAQVTLTQDTAIGTSRAIVEKLACLALMDMMLKAEHGLSYIKSISIANGVLTYEVLRLSVSRMVTFDDIDERTIVINRYAREITGDKQSKLDNARSNWMQYADTWYNFDAFNWTNNRMTNFVKAYFGLESLV